MQASLNPMSFMIGTKNHNYKPRKHPATIEEQVCGGEMGEKWSGVSTVGRSRTEGPKVVTTGWYERPH